MKSFQVLSENEQSGPSTESMLDGTQVGGTEFWQMRESELKFQNLINCVGLKRVTALQRSVGINYLRYPKYALEINSQIKVSVQTLVVLHNSIKNIVRNVYRSVIYVPIYMPCKPICIYTYICNYERS